MHHHDVSLGLTRTQRRRPRAASVGKLKGPHASEVKIGAGNGIRTRDFDLGKVALYH